MADADGPVGVSVAARVSNRKVQESPGIETIPDLVLVSSRGSRTAGKIGKTTNYS